MGDIALLQKMADENLADANVLFQEPAPSGEIVFLNFAGSEWVRHYYRTLEAIRRDLAELAENPDSARRYGRVVDRGGADSIDEWNLLAALSHNRSLATNFETTLFSVLAVRGFDRSALADLTSPRAVDARFFLRHGIRSALNLSLFRLYQAELKLRSGEELSRLRPEALRLSEEATRFTAEFELNRMGGMTMEAIGDALAAHDRFGASRAFRYADGNFTAVELSDLRPADHFFGFAAIRRSFEEHLSRFAAGYPSEPLLISSLPGLGKTQMTMAYTLAQTNLTLILAGPETLEHELESLLESLRWQTQHRFVVFFDDIDPRTLDWYLFRTNVGGSLALPENVLVVLAANYDFPASILSRGRGVSFPTFDEIRCEEMIEDFLRFKGLQQPSPELVSVIAADYTEEFGQKKFPELSPRTLMRYLGWYETDPKKRKRLLDQSKLEMIVRPDARLFYEFNLKQLKLLYGEDKIGEVLREKLQKDVES